MRVLLIDDTFMVRRAWETLLENYPDIAFVGALNRADDVVEQVQSLDPTIVVMDIGMPGKNAFDAVRELKASRPDIRVVMHTAYCASEKIQAAFDAGAWGIIDKLMPADEIINFLRAVADGRAFFPDDDGAGVSSDGVR